MPNGGRGGPARAGGPKSCVCPSCGYKERHARGVPCSRRSCPRCGMVMVAKWE